MSTVCGRSHAVAVVFGLSLALSAVSRPTGAGELRALPLGQCNDLRAALAESLEFTAEFTAEVEWFRDSDLGLKGMRCRVAAIGDVRPGGESPPLAALGDGVRATLARRGWKGGDILGRFGESADDYVAYAVRQGRATCHVTIERMFPPRRSEGAGGRPPIDDRPVRLTVSCFVG